MSTAPLAQGLRRGVIKDPATKNLRLAHIRGDVRSVATNLLNADNPNPPDVVALATPMTKDEIAALEKSRKRYLRGKRGKPPHSMAEIVMWGPPRNKSPNPWPREKSQEWAEQTLKWVERHFPDSPVLAASVHYDEGSPHVHVALFPMYTDKLGETAYGWKRAESAATARLMGEEPQLNSAPQRVRSQKQAGQYMERLLDDYHQHVGAPHGLTRGVKGSQRKNKAVEIDEASRLHAQDREVQLDVREAEIDKRAVRVERGYRRHKAELTEDYEARKADLQKRRLALKEEKAKLEREQARLDKLDIEIEDKNRISREFAASTVDERLRLHAENKELRAWVERAKPFVSEGMARRKAEAAQRRADAAYQQRLDKLEADDAELEAILQLEAEREEQAKQAEAERQRKDGEKVISMRAFSRLRRGRGGKGKGRAM